MLGEGGMGRVYLGFSPVGRAVAVKVVSSRLASDPAFRARFRREVDAARGVSGLHTAPVIAAGLDDPLPWLATAFVAGPSLRSVIRARGPLPAEAVWKLAGGLAEALTDIHASGLVHRDLKPENVLLADDGPKVIDFGISRALDATVMTETGVVLGTPAFMSPEQAEGRPTGEASDVFALGSVLAYAATGRPPFGGGPAAAAIFRIVSAGPDLDGVPAPLRALISQCLEKIPARRPGLAAVVRAISARAADSRDSPTAASFWPEAVRELIRSYQGALDAAVPGIAGAASGAWDAAGSGGSPVGAGGGPAGAEALSSATGDATSTVRRVAAASPASVDAVPPGSGGPGQRGRRGRRGVPGRRGMLAAAIAIVLAIAGTAGYLAASGSSLPVPALLGPPDFNGYCVATGQGQVSLIDSAYAYGWHCMHHDATGDPANVVCGMDYHLPVSDIAVTFDYYNPYSWECWRADRQLSPPDWAGYCAAKGWGKAALNATFYAYGWYCTGTRSSPDINTLCEWTNHTTSLVIASEDFADPHSWQCWA
jgi:hypothetical protein